MRSARPRRPRPCRPGRARGGPETRPASPADRRPVRPLDGRTRSRPDTPRAARPARGGPPAARPDPATSRHGDRPCSRPEYWPARRRNRPEEQVSARGGRGYPPGRSWRRRAESSSAISGWWDQKREGPVGLPIIIGPETTQMSRAIPSSDIGRDFSGDARELGRESNQRRSENNDSKTTFGSFAWDIGNFVYESFRKQPSRRYPPLEGAGIFRSLTPLELPPRSARRPGRSSLR